MGHEPEALLSRKEKRAGKNSNTQKDNRGAGKEVQGAAGKCADAGDERTQRGAQENIVLSARADVFCDGCGNDGEGAHEERAYQFDAERYHSGKDKEKEQLLPQASPTLHAGKFA